MSKSYEWLEMKSRGSFGKLRPGTFRAVKPLKELFVIAITVANMSDLFGRKIKSAPTIGDRELGSGFTMTTSLRHIVNGS